MAELDGLTDNLTAVSPLLEGVISRVPADPDDGVYATVGDFDDTHEFGPCLWPARVGAPPAEGDRCLVFVPPGGGDEWVLVWWPDGGDPPVTLGGSTLLTGNTAPAGGLGNDGDVYYDYVAHNIYGPKTAGAWGTATSLVGPAGAAGAAGAAGPNNNLVGQTVPAFTSTADDGKGLLWQTTAWIKSLLARLDTTSQQTFLGGIKLPNGNTTVPALAVGDPLLAFYRGALNTLRLIAGTTATVMQWSPTLITSSILHQFNRGVSYLQTFYDPGNSPRLVTVTNAAITSITSQSIPVDPADATVYNTYSLPFMGYLTDGVTREIVLVTAVNTGTGVVTALRGQEGTAAQRQAWASGTTFGAFDQEFICIGRDYAPVLVVQNIYIRTKVLIPPRTTISGFSAPFQGQTLKIVDGSGDAANFPLDIYTYDGLFIDTIDQAFGAIEVEYFQGTLRYSTLNRMTKVSGSNTRFLKTGTGSPEGVVTATEPSLYIDLAATKLYAHPGGNVNTGWVEK